MQSPTMEGAVPNATANLLIEEGRALSKQIEVQSLRSEAQMKAPAIATAYADAFTRLGQGDLSAFGEIERANALSVGNPFLQAMASDAQKTAGMMASNYFDTQQFNSRMAAEREMFTQKAGLERELQGNRIDAEGKRFEAVEKRQDDQQAAILERQELDDWRASEEAKRKEYQAQLMKYNEELDSEVRLAEVEGRSPRKMTPPKEPTPAPKPTPKAKEKFSLVPHGGGMDFNIEVPMPNDPLVNEKLPNGKKASVIEPDAGLMARGEPPTRPVAQPTQQQQTKPQTIERTFGNLTFELPAPKSKSDVEVSETIKTRTGSVNVKRAKGDEPVAKLANALADIEAEDPAFSRWVSENKLQGAGLSVRKVGEGKNAVYQPVAIYSDKTEKKFTEIDPATQQPTATPKTVSETVYKNFVETQSLLAELKGKVKMYENVSDGAKKQFREEYLQVVARGEKSLEEINQRLAFRRIPPITQNELDQATFGKLKAQGGQKTNDFTLTEPVKGWQAGLRTY